jgi:hypothetical protein
VFETAGSGLFLNWIVRWILRWEEPAGMAWIERGDGDKGGLGGGEEEETYVRTVPYCIIL